MKTMKVGVDGCRRQSIDTAKSELSCRTQKDKGIVVISSTDEDRGVKCRQGHSQSQVNSLTEIAHNGKHCGGFRDL